MLLSSSVRFWRGRQVCFAAQPVQRPEAVLPHVDIQDPNPEVPPRCATLDARATAAGRVNTSMSPIGCKQRPSTIRGVDQTTTKAAAKNSCRKAFRCVKYSRRPPRCRDSAVLWQFSYSGSSPGLDDRGSDPT